MRRFFCILSIIAFGLNGRADPIQGLVLPFKQVAVSSPVDDIIEEVAVEEGATVEKGQVLARLVSRAEELEVARTQKLIEKTEFDQKASASLLKEKMMSKEEALTKEVDLQLAKILHATAEYRLKQKTIASPMAGIVVQKFKEAGESATRVDKLFEVVDIDKLYLQFYLDPELIHKIELGSLLKVHFPALPDQNDYDAEIAFIDSRIDAASGLFRVKLLMDNPRRRIKAGMRAEADFQTVAKDVKLR